jgi:hypothetical protein
MSIAFQRSQILLLSTALGTLLFYPPTIPWS